MTESLEKRYPEGAAYIQQAIDEHGQEWVLEHYYEQLYPLARIMAMPEKEELPFFDATEHEPMSQTERTEMYEAWGRYRETLKAGKPPDR